MLILCLSSSLSLGRVDAPEKSPNKGQAVLCPSVFVLLVIEIPHHAPCSVRLGFKYAHTSSSTVPMDIATSPLVPNERNSRFAQHEKEHYLL